MCASCSQDGSSTDTTFTCGQTRDVAQSLLLTLLVVTSITIFVKINKNDKKESNKLCDVGKGKTKDEGEQPKKSA